MKSVKLAACAALIFLTGCGFGVVEFAVVVGVGAAAASAGGKDKPKHKKFPPVKVANPSPANAETSVPATTVLMWDAADNAATYRVYFGTANPPQFVAEIVDTAYDPLGLLAYSTTYYWRVDSKNDDGVTTGDVWSFVSEQAPTSPPAEVIGPVPDDVSQNISITTNVIWNASSGATGYLVHFGAANPPPYMANTSNTSYDPSGDLAYSTTYYWRIIAYNGSGNASSSLWSFSTESEPLLPPDVATLPVPTSTTSNVSITTDLSWTAAARADGYYVFFGTAYDPPYAGENTGETAYDPGTLSYDTTYYWKVVPYNLAGNASGVTIWSFRTENGPVSPEYITNSIGMRFRLIPSGSFLMGSWDNDANATANEKPKHTVNITQPFYMGVYEVTQKQWFDVMGAYPSYFSGDNNPVETISWNDIQTFISTLNAMENTTVYRLPTEAEWEYSCRAGTNTIYHFSDSSTQLGNYAWYSANSGSATHPVGTRLPNAWGLYDMHGNIWEWVNDWYDSAYYSSSPLNDPQGPTGPLATRNLRGGGWNGTITGCRSAYRDSDNPDAADYDVGFRLCCGVRPQYITNSIGMHFRLIPSGSFLMGSWDNDINASSNEKPKHSVNITQPFYIGVYEVTQKQWFDVMGTQPSYFTGDNLPVEQVSWDNAQAFIAALNALENTTIYRLPTEAEWEYCCRAGTNTIYYFSDSPVQLGNYAWYDGSSGATTHPVGTRLPNAWWLYDMHGNVWEWVTDWYDNTYYSISPENDPQGPAGSPSGRVLRGGGWVTSETHCRSASRDVIAPDAASDNVGFRLCRSISP